MTPKTKAKKLVEKFQSELSGALYSPYNNVSVKQCALTCVNEILLDDMYGMREDEFNKRLEFWQEVKEEIEKL